MYFQSTCGHITAWPLEFAFLTIGGGQGAYVFFLSGPAVC